MKPVCPGFLGLALLGLGSLIACDQLPELNSDSVSKKSKSTTDDPARILSIRKIEPYEDQGRFQLIHVDAKTNGETKTLILRMDSATGTTWRLDQDFLKWVLIEGSDPNDPLGIRPKPSQPQTQGRETAQEGDIVYGPQGRKHIIRGGKPVPVE